MISLKEMTRGVDISNAFKSLLNDLKVPIFKLLSIITDGAAGIIGRIDGFMAVCQNKDEYPAFLTYYCIIHQQVLTSMRLNKISNGLSIQFEVKTRLNYCYIPM